MVERRTNASQFAGVNALQKDIERLTKERDAATKERDDLTKERENAQTEMLKDHGVALTAMQKTLDRVVDQTKDLPKVIEGIKDRLTAQEKWKILMTGYAAAFGIMGAFLGWVTNLIFGVHR